MYIISKCGTAEQRRSFLPPLLAGDTPAFLSITEPNVGSDVSGIETRATDKGDHYLLNGTKMFATHGSIADIGIVFASTDPGQKGKGISAFVIERNKCVYQTRNIEKMIAHAIPSSEIIFEDTKVPKENLLGNPGEGLKIALTTLNIGRVAVALGSVGIAQACLEASIRYAKQRKQFGRLIGSFQFVQGMIVEMHVLTEAARYLGYRAASLLDKGVKCNLEASTAKLFATEAAFKVASHALQVHGGYGYAKEFPVERYFRDARGATIPEGTSEIQKLIIGRDLLGISAFI
jgi:alkylation response protein AidB-like acyl-CoA dehydrogenase